MKKLLHRSWLLLLSFTALTCSAEPATLVMGDNVLSDYRDFIGSRDVQAIKRYSGEGARRDVIDVVLALQALHLGGYSGEIEFVPQKSYRRIVYRVSSGNVAMSAPLVWQEDTQPSKHYISEAVIADGEFVVGLYTSPNNRRALALNSLAELSDFTVVSTQQWRSDWRTLKRIHFKSHYDTLQWPMMVKMVWAGRADMTLAPFQPTDNMALYHEGLTLIPIPNIKLALAGSRHWIVSKQHPEGQALFTALERGLQQLRSGGTVTRAYTESGFFDARVADWQQIN